MSEHFNSKGNLKEDYFSGECELQPGETEEEICIISQKGREELYNDYIGSGPIESDCFDEKGFDEYNDRYIVQIGDYSEKAGGITLELLKRNELPIEFIEIIRNSNIIREINQLEINKGYIIELEQEEPNQYNLLIGDKTYKIDLTEETMININ